MTSSKQPRALSRTNDSERGRVKEGWREEISVSAAAGSGQSERIASSRHRKANRHAKRTDDGGRGRAWLQQQRQQQQSHSASVCSLVVAVAMPYRAMPADATTTTAPLTLLRDARHALFNQDAERVVPGERGSGRVNFVTLARAQAVLCLCVCACDAMRHTPPEIKAKHVSISSRHTGR